MSSSPQDPFGSRSSSGASWSGGQVPPPQAWGPPGPGAYGRPPQTESRAIIALVCAVASWVLCPLVPAIVALVLAGGAQRDIEASAGRLTGEGLVTASKVIAWANIAVAALVVVGLGLFALIVVVGSSAAVTAAPA